MTASGPTAPGGTGRLRHADRAVRAVPAEAVQDRVPVPRPPVPDGGDVAAVLADPSRLSHSFQPIVSTATGDVAGWEVLSRFRSADGRPSAWGPAEWFAAMQGDELGARLEALSLRRALQSVDDLPADTFLTVNVSPGALTSAEVGAVLAERRDLSRVILEITETEAVQDLSQVSSVCAGIRAAGGTVAVDDAGAGYAGLALIAHLRPQLVKVDRELVAGCDTDPVRLSLIEVLGVWASGMDAWLLAEGVETPGEYAAVLALGVPLVQGWYSGRPAPVPTGVGRQLHVDLRRHRARVGLQESVASVMAVWPVVPLDEEPGGGYEHAGGGDTYVLARHGWPVALVRPTVDGPSRCPVTLRVRPSEDVREALRRAMARDAAHRYDPVAVTDPQGWTVGVLTVESLVTAVLAR